VRKVNMEIRNPNECCRKLQVEELMLKPMIELNLKLGIPF